MSAILDELCWHRSDFGILAPPPTRTPAVALTWSAASLAQESARDLVRAREDARGDLMRARHRPSKLLLRQGIVYCVGQAWTGTHDAWLRRQRFDSPALQMTFESDYDAVLSVKARRDRLDEAITVMAANSQFTPNLRRLSCLRGVSTLTGFALAVEVGDWHRFTGNTVGAFVGLVPSEYSSGASRVRGSITKTCNTHVRRLLVEAAWHHRARYAPGTTMRDRWELASPAARTRGASILGPHGGVVQLCWTRTGAVLRVTRLQAGTLARQIAMSYLPHVSTRRRVLAMLVLAAIALPTSHANAANTALRAAGAAPQGSWAGPVTGDSSKYTLQVTFSTVDSDPYATVVYPELNCSGKWTYRGRTSTGAFRFRERINRNPDGRCATVVPVLVDRLSKRKLFIRFIGYDGEALVTKVAPAS